MNPRCGLLKLLRAVREGQCKPLELEDLDELKGVSEGFHFEFKREPIEAGEFAKQVASFANSDGGWIFIGINESKGVASEVVGINPSQLKKLEQQFSTAIENHLDPIPYFDTHVVSLLAEAVAEVPTEDGILEERELKAEVPAIADAEEVPAVTVVGKSDMPTERFVVGVLVPAGNQTPYIHKDGQIHRRLGNKTRTEHVNRIEDLERLFSRRFETGQRLDRVLKHEIDTPHVRWAIFPDPRYRQEFSQRLSFFEFKRQLKDEQAPLYMPFDQFQATATGYRARHVFQNPLNVNGISFELFHDGWFLIEIPIFTLKIGDANGVDWEFWQDRLLNVSPSLIDLRWMYLHFTTLGLLVQRINAVMGWRSQRMSALSIYLPDESVPILDVEFYRSFVEEYRLPILRRQTIRSPDQPTAMSEFQMLRVCEEDTMGQIVTSVRPLIELLEAFGLPQEILHLNPDWLYELSESTRTLANLSVGKV